MRGLLRIFSLHGLVVLIAAVLVVLAIDGGSLVITRLSVPDDVRQAGHKAAAVAKRGPATRQTAISALAAARQDAESHDITVRSKGFTIYPGGAVTLTGTETAPTLLMHRLPIFDSLTEVSTTLTVEPLPYD